MTAGYAGGPGFVAEDDVIAAVAAAYGDGLREGAAAERDRLQAEMDIVRAAGAAAERNAREGRKAGAAAERDRCHRLVFDAGATYYDDHGIKTPAADLLLQDPS